MAVKRAEKNSLNTATNGGVTVEIPTEEEMTPGVLPAEEPEETTVPAAEPRPETVPEEPAPEPEEPPAEPEKKSVMTRLLSNTPETSSSGVQVDTSALTPDTENIPKEPEKNVRIRLREDHRCVIAMKRYDFKKGKCYDVPPNVKQVLNKRGLLAPL